MFPLDTPIKIFRGYPIEFGTDQADHLPLDPSIDRLDAKELGDRSFGLIVTGSAGTLGTAVVRALTKRGDRIIGLDRLVPGTSSATSLPVELTDAASVRAAVDQAAERLGQIDVFVHTVGIMRVSSFMRTTEGDLKKQLDVNLMGAFRVCQAVAARMLRTGGRILIMTSDDASFINGQTIAIDGGASTLKTFSTSAEA